jgi:hypothetical protein
MEKQEVHVHRDHAERKRRRRKRRWIILGSILGLLLIFRLFLPMIVLHYVNKKLSEIKEYYGHVDDIDIALLRGAYVINDIKLVKVNAEKDKTDTVPFFVADRIDLSVEWNSLFKGSFVGEIYLEKPVINFVKGEHKEEDVKADTSDFRQLINDLMPLTVNHFEVDQGQIHFKDISRKPALDIFMTSISMVATNLSNVNDSSKVMPAHLDCYGDLYGGTFKLQVDFDALNKVPTFDMNAELGAMDLTKVNDMLKAYGNFEVKKGRFGLYTEFAARNGTFGGYVKPLIKDMEVEQMEGDLKDVLWEMLVGAAANTLKNKDTKDLATKVSIQGKFENPSINTWRAVGLVLRNAFFHALQPAIDNSINIHKLKDDKPKTLLEKIFGTGKTDKEKNKDSKVEDKKKK